MSTTGYHAPIEVASWRSIEAARDDSEDYSDTESENTAYRYSTDEQIYMELRGNPAQGANGVHKAVTTRPQDTFNFVDEVDDLPALQTRLNLDENDRLDPIYDDDPASYDLVAPPPEAGAKEEYSLEKRSQALFSKEHLQVIFSDPEHLLKFTSFLTVHRPQAVPLLVHYVDALKSLRAIHYANAILEGLDAVDDLDFTKKAVPLSKNEALEARTTAAFEQLAKEELPAFITHRYIEVVSASISARISGSLAPHLREASEGLAEVFCLTDPSRPDNPIVFASEEFNRTTQYGMSYILGRNCRFLQGPWTNPLSVKRLREAVQAGKQHQEVFLNYRRDGSPFMNLLLTAPLTDSRGKVRYFIGAQVDVSGLVKEGSELESFQRLLELQAEGKAPNDPQKPSPDKDDPLRELGEMMNLGEMSIIRRYGGKMHRESYEDDDTVSLSGQPRLLIKDPNTLTPPTSRDISGKLSGVYQNYLLVRPYPALRILFASPSQRLPGVLQTPFLNKIGGSDKVRHELQMAFMEGRGWTAKCKWLSRLDDPTKGRNKYLHATPLIGSNGNIGVWMIVIVDEEKRVYGRPRAQAPPVSTPDRNRRPDSSSSSKRIINGYEPSGVNGVNGTSGASGGGSINSFRID